MLHQHARPAVAGNYLAGAIAGALVTGFGLLVLSGLVSPIPTEVRAGLALSLLLLLGLRVLGVLCLELPQRQVQIPRETFNQTPQRSAFRFAFELGTGVRTYITATAPYAFAVILILCAPATIGGAALSAALGAIGYGLGRSLVIVSQTVLRGPAIEHPRWALRAGDVIAVGTALALAIQHLLQA